MEEEKKQTKQSRNEKSLQDSNNEEDFGPFNPLISICKNSSSARRILEGGFSTYKWLCAIQKKLWENLLEGLSEGFNKLKNDIFQLLFSTNSDPTPVQTQSLAPTPTSTQNPTPTSTQKKQHES